MSPFRKKEFYQGGYYHIYNRGANQDLIFFNPDNYLYCLQLLGKYKIKYKISIIGYCLMPNHYHLLIRQDLNPVKAGLVKLPDEWQYSNYLDWIGKRNGILTERSFMIDNFGNSANYREFVMDYLQEKKAEKIIEKYMLD